MASVTGVTADESSEGLLLPRDSSGIGRDAKLSLWGLLSCGRCRGDVDDYDPRRTALAYGGSSPAPASFVAEEDPRRSAPEVVEVRRPWLPIGLSVLGLLVVVGIVVCVWLNHYCPKPPRDLPPQKHYSCAGKTDGWSGERLAWCCSKEGVGCDQVVLDCDKGDPEAWSVKKKDFCCKNVEKGCSPASESHAKFDCDADADRWLSAWPADKKAWCCQHGGRGCPPALPQG
mmetsp:Transcript_32059/g.68618  ORF Transcript_32059/g.68618 Transcript_32059/m.68618 type:complete len:230 (+) Transcript_32059:163-852(+)|eukprot:CAMPEP_0206458554 /NCGR_PEP_ID=MMETSP0324_2-20121206/23639_1 /ASSEMBLY_ACC=CAM_ASM_000836 /TAXON_ID=2866 /ORGANISM="Crypthecodinium cohnii, Strain Seligo" /LENGTH=229 /DNA_ID=CAMNT_0053929915 /DNA_START=86 /DNA_END=775 /DNA_ORIENTATION=+